MRGMGLLAVLLAAVAVRSAGSRPPHSVSAVVHPADWPFQRLRHSSQRLLALGRHRDHVADVDICHRSTPSEKSKSQHVSPTQSTAPMDGDPIGHVDVTNATLIAGWASDPDAPPCTHCNRHQHRRCGVEPAVGKRGARRRWGTRVRLAAS